jgi:hypothetical protein
MDENDRKKAIAEARMVAESRKLPAGGLGAKPGPMGPAQTNPQYITLAAVETLLREHEARILETFEHIIRRAQARAPDARMKEALTFLAHETALATKTRRDIIDAK